MLVTLVPAEGPALDELPALPLATAGLELDTVLGEGAAGIVHVARQELLDRDVAVKRLKAGSPHRALARLLHEGRTMGSLEHPNIVPVHAIGIDADDQPALVMKRVEGRAWEVGERSLEDEIGVLVEAGNALQYAHAHGIVHRDLKPANVLLGPHGEVYLGDWGISAPAGQIARAAGTPAYMAPEMFEDGVATAAMDVYTLGACLHEILTGDPPNTGTTVDACRTSALEGTTPTGDAELVALVRAACAVESTERAALSDVLVGLKDWLKHRGAVRLADAGFTRLRQLRDAETLDANALTECLFAFKQALEQRPAHPPYESGLRELLHLAVSDATTRDVQPEMAASWLADLESLGDDTADLRAQLDASRSRQEARNAMAYDADFGVAYRPRARVYAGWMGLFGGLAAIGTLGGFIDQETHSGALIMAVLFLGTLGIAATVGWRHVTQNQANRATLAAFALMGVAMVGQRSVGLWFEIPIAYVYAVDAAFLGVATTTLGMTYGRVTRMLGLIMLFGSPLILLAPTGWSAMAFVSVILATPVAFVLAMFGGFGR